MESGTALALGWMLAGAGLALDIRSILEHVRAGGGKSGSTVLVPLLFYGLSSALLHYAQLGDVAAVPLLAGGIIHVIQLKFTGPRWFQVKREPYGPTREVVACRSELFPALKVYDHVLRPAPDHATAQWIREESAINLQQPHYLWAADGQWYRLVNMRRTKRVDLWSRFWFHSDLIVAEFDLEVCEEAPFTDSWIKRELLRHLKLVAIERGEMAAKDARRRLKSMNSQPELFAWLDPLIPHRVRYRIDPGKHKAR